ncbi:BON domain protein [Pirellulimonas nuda]|uniref:BON domain protein n=1 Tax=Pirellulimonas nuda TaxID=2528009 RepID=A0A518DBW4_9BACT|nr:BON domain-containing protein [Pirellulimonas nuda]QDU88953.1 BON domain protein [Pirellulimonas nuda]
MNTVTDRPDWPAAIESDQARRHSSHSAHLALRARKYAELNSVECEIFRGFAVLEGEVSTYYLKQLAQETVLHIDGVASVSNRLLVT